ncbi:MAG TPA: hypothetical protein VFB63_29180 [Bryobacteraceae bacterium]|nr:hypothetical protein [Bryobacteraceae bacterium]
MRFVIIVSLSLSLGPRLFANQNPEPGEPFQWKPALRQSALFLGIQHAFRFATEPGSRAAMRGPFVRDYVRSVKGMSGWRDGDPFIVNYVGHPFMGAVSGYIAVQNDPRFRRAQFGSSAVYWKSRLRAAGFATLYSANFELGPASEASLGNVGLGGTGAGAVDLVVTPLGGLGVMVAEDALDRYVIQWAERASGNLAYRIAVRSLLNPTRSFANMLRMRPPWFRDLRRGIREP